ncbi:MAG: 50S ribosomal protein L30 [Thermoplasmata archaeon]
MYAVIRIRGRTGISYDIEKTLKLMRLTRINHMVLINETDDMKGMLQKSKDYITWGEINRETLIELLKRRGRLMGDKVIDEDYLKKINVKSIEDLADMILEGKITYSDLPDIKPIFRLNPPVSGYKSTRRSVRENGDLGYRGEKINELIRRMMVM